MGNYHVCVYAICKNEAKFARRWMDSMSEADHIVVLDTGSTDGTPQLLRSLGATGKLAGFRCTVYMIERIQENPEQLQLITKRLYRETGKKFGVSAASVERNLRTLIHFCWSRTDHSFLAHIAGTDLRTPPTNSEFLDMLASYLREMGG